MRRLKFLLFSPTAPAGDWDGTLIDYNVRAERMGWLPSSPQLSCNPLELAAAGEEGTAGYQSLRHSGTRAGKNPLRLRRPR